MPKNLFFDPHWLIGLLCFLFSSSCSFGGHVTTLP